MYKEYRLCFQTEDGKWHPDNELVYDRLADAVGFMKDMEDHYKQYPGDKCEQKIQSRRVSEWTDERV